MHPAAAEIDLQSLQVDHGPDDVFARVHLARTWFGKGSKDGDVADSDTVYLAIEPLGTQHYMKYREFRVITWAPYTRERGVKLGVRDRVLEWEVKRRREQTRFRVLAWADARRWDRIPGRGLATLTIPKGAWQAK